jgi:hypothetical protein
MGGLMGVSFIATLPLLEIGILINVVLPDNQTKEKCRVARYRINLHINLNKQDNIPAFLFSWLPY